jgi:hypothetical protein
MPRSTYETIRSVVLEQDSGFFEQRPDKTVRMGDFHGSKKCRCALHAVLRAATDQLVEVLRMSESLIMECLSRYCDGIVETLGGIYVQEPTAEELAEIEARFAELGFLG